MGEKVFVWGENLDGLILLGTQTTEEEKINQKKKKKTAVEASKVYCPHKDLILNFHETLNQSEKIKFRKNYLRKVSPNEPDVIILQDIKDLVMFLLITPVSPQFINFFHLPIVDRFLRALIIYFQCYVTIWEELMEERNATMKKAPNPLAQGYRFRYMDEMHSLRSILGREYADLIVGCQDTTQYHHMVAGKNGASTATQSQGEKDLRIYEVLICMAHRIVWIALQRKYFNLIEIELHRLLRTDSYNTAKRRGFSQLVQDMLEDDARVLHGRKIQTKRKLLQNSPLIQDLVFSDCDYRLLCLGLEDKKQTDQRIIYLQNALLIEEEKLPQLGIKIGILGLKRSAFDVLLRPQEEESTDTEPSQLQLSDKGKKSRIESSQILSEKGKKSIAASNHALSSGKGKKSTALLSPALSADKGKKSIGAFSIALSDMAKFDKKSVVELELSFTEMRKNRGTMPSCETKYTISRDFPVKLINIPPKGYKKAREEARKKWLYRELHRRKTNLLDYSIATLSGETLNN